MNINDAAGCSSEESLSIPKDRQVWICPLDYGKIEFPGLNFIMTDSSRKFNIYVSPVRGLNVTESKSSCESLTILKTL